MAFAKSPGSAFGAPRRVFTAPTGPLSHQEFSPATASSSDLVETLYNHPSVKILTFSAGPRNISFGPGSALPSTTEVEPGTLPWSSRLERTIAVGPLRIYRAPGSVAFLNCGSALQPILPKSQCWCIDEESSKFILQIRRPQYWRIEISVANPDDRKRAHLLREVFDQVLQFEKTPCPFKRAFTVELPEPPQTPVKKRPWTPVRQPSVHTPPASATTLRTSESSSGAAAAATPTDKSETTPSRFEDSPAGNLTPVTPLVQRRRPFEREPKADKTITKVPAPISIDKIGRQTSLPMHLGSRQGSDDVVVLQPQLDLDDSASSQLMAIPPAASLETLSTSPSESSASFHSTESWLSPLTPLPPSPPSSNPASPKTFPYPHDNILLPQSAAPQTEISDITITPNRDGKLLPSPTGADIVSLESSSETSSVYEDAPKAISWLPEPTDAPTSRLANAASITDLEQTSPQASTSASVDATPRPNICHRATTSAMSVSQNRALSPLPPAANLFTPHRQFRAFDSSNRASTRLTAVRRIPSVIFSKTCEILLSPPSHLISLMLQVAARIAAGEWRGLVFGTGEAGEKIPVEWDYSEEGEGAWAEDDDYFSEASRGRSFAHDQSPSIRRRTGYKSTFEDDDDDDIALSGSDTDLDNRSWEVD